MKLFKRESSGMTAKNRLADVIKQDRVSNIPHINEMKSGIEETIKQYTSDTVSILVNKSNISNQIKIDIKIG